MKHPHKHLPLLVFACSVTLFVFGLYIYMYRTVGISLSRALEARDAVVTEQSLKMQEKKLTEMYENSTLDRMKLISLFVQDSQTIPFIETIEAFAQQTGSKVTISSLQSDNLEGASVGTLGNISLNVQVDGPWSSVVRTLKLAEVLPYQVSVSDVRLSLGGETSNGSIKSGVQWNGSFVIKATLIHEPTQ